MNDKSNQKLVAYVLLNRALPSVKKAPHHRRRRQPSTFNHTPSPLCECESMDDVTLTSDDLSDRLTEATDHILESFNPSVSRLTSLPSELLLRIFTFAEPDELLALVQTSDGIRRFIKQHAGQISNGLIQAKFSKALRLAEDKQGEGGLILGPLGYSWLYSRSDAPSPPALYWRKGEREVCLWEIDTPRDGHADLKFPQDGLSAVGPKSLFASPPHLLRFLQKLHNKIEEFSHCRKLLFSRISKVKVCEIGMFALAECLRMCMDKNTDEDVDCATIQRHLRMVGRADPWGKGQKPTSFTRYFGISGAESRKDDDERVEGLRVKAMVEVLRMRIENMRLGSRVC